MELTSPQSPALMLPACAICGGGALDNAADLPGLPMTGVFVPNPQTVAPQRYNQALHVCADCGHIQLRGTPRPQALYTPSYAHRSSGSHLAEPASRCVTGFLARITGGRQMNCILEVGCNDFVLLRKMIPMGRHVVGIDPIWAGIEMPPVPEGARVLGGLVQDIDLAAALPAPPDLIVSTHNLEHIVDPVPTYLRLMDVAADDALFVIEVPDADSMLRGLRFDQVFHHHLHYFTLAALLSFIRAVGGHYVAHELNARNWGGTIVVAFRKGHGPRPDVPAAAPVSVAAVAGAFARFRIQMGELRRRIEGMDCPLWGYGAGQMVPSLAYHLDSDLGFLHGILDDNPQRYGLGYPGLKPVVRQLGPDVDLAKAGVLITAPDAVRPILASLLPRDPLHLLVPFHRF